ncbi:hypothetical protein Tco_1224221 [Tanacetum coccineum]
MFPLDEPCEEIGSEAFKVPTLKDEEIAQITVLGLCVSFPNVELSNLVFQSIVHVLLERHMTLFLCKLCHFSFVLDIVVKQVQEKSSVVQIAILQILPFEEGCLPVKYLGVPLVSSRLIFRDYKGLLEKVQARIDDWKNKSLSTAGRLQLIHLVIGSMHVYWASVFIFPSRVLLDIEQIMRSFLWKGRAKVAWEVLCLPKEEGGLGVRRLDLFNKVLMVSHIWKLVSIKDSLWVKWVHSYKLKGRNFWDMPLRGNMS